MNGGVILLIPLHIVSAHLLYSIYTTISTWLIAGKQIIFDTGTRSGTNKKYIVVSALKRGIEVVLCLTLINITEDDTFTVTLFTFVLLTPTLWYLLSYPHTRIVNISTCGILAVRFYHFSYWDINNDSVDVLADIGDNHQNTLKFTSKYIKLIS